MKPPWKTQPHLTILIQNWKNKNPPIYEYPIQHWIYPCTKLNAIADWWMIICFYFNIVFSSKYNSFRKCVRMHWSPMWVKRNWNSIAKLDTNLIWTNIYRQPIRQNKRGKLTNSHIIPCQRNTLPTFDGMRLYVLVQFGIITFFSFVRFYFYFYFLSNVDHRCQVNLHGWMKASTKIYSRHQIR